MRKILIADDSLTARMILKRCIDMLGPGNEFREAKDGAEALAMASKDKPDLIIIDLNMPVLNGEQLLGALKADEDLRWVPVVVASSAANPEKKARLAALGAHATVTKPVSPAGLQEALGPLMAA